MLVVHSLSYAEGQQDIKWIDEWFLKGGLEYENIRFTSLIYTVYWRSVYLSDVIYICVCVGGVINGAFTISMVQNPDVMHVENFHARNVSTDFPK